MACDCDDCLEYADTVLPPAIERAVERWELNRQRQDHPCGCVTVRGLIRRWRPYTCPSHRGGPHGRGEAPTA